MGEAGVGTLPQVAVVRRRLHAARDHRLVTRASPPHAHLHARLVLAARALCPPTSPRAPRSPTFPRRPRPAAAPPHAPPSTPTSATHKGLLHGPRGRLVLAAAAAAALSTLSASMMRSASSKVMTCVRSETERRSEHEVSEAWKKTLARSAVSVVEEVSTCPTHGRLYELGLERRVHEALLLAAAVAARDEVVRRLLQRRGVGKEDNRSGARVCMPGGTNAVRRQRAALTSCVSCARGGGVFCGGSSSIFLSIVKSAAKESGKVCHIRGPRSTRPTSHTHVLTARRGPRSVRRHGGDPARGAA